MTKGETGTGGDARVRRESALRIRKVCALRYDEISGLLFSKKGSAILFLRSASFSGFSSHFVGGMIFSRLLAHGSFRLLARRALYL